MTERRHTYGKKRATNVTIDRQILNEARELGINLSATFEAALVDAVRMRRRERWIAENADAIDAYNEDVRKNGVFSDGRRTF